MAPSPPLPPSLSRSPFRRSTPEFLDALLSEAIARRASDLHLEPRDPEGGGATRWGVRLRVDGILRPLDGLLSAESAPLVLSRIKILAGLDIAIRRRPQDGGFTHLHAGRPLRIRVSALPVEGGEKMVLRILDPEHRPGSLDALGFTPHDLERVRGLLRGGRGVVLVVGPTGSGKSSTLAAALMEMNRTERSVVTLEDPVEVRVPGVQHLQLAPASGLTLPVAFRAVLRQDPDVILVGEIRDRETAEIAMAAAMTGHLVLSTLHASDAVGAIPRLLHMGVPPHLVAGGLSGVVAQRLLRTPCGSCRGAAPVGCEECEGGYRGRVGVFEVLVVGDALREAVVRDVGTPRLRELATRGGMRGMAEDARRKASEGRTTPHEIARVLHRDPGGVPPCSACGASPPEGALGCPGCGRALHPVCAPCGQVLDPSWRWCPGCRRPIVP
jgi:type IV pilus assembly protein PilB